MEWCFDPQLKGEQGGWYNLFWDKDSKEKEQGIIMEKELLRNVPSKNYGSNFIMEKTQNIFWFVNNSEYHHREMGLT